ncbi:unnamed protein product, partial [Choristocarpus tenellus]
LLSYHDVWRRQGLEFFQYWQEQDGPLSLFNPYTGEVIYDLDRWGAPISGARKFSWWIEPTLGVPEAIHEIPMKEELLHDNQGRLKDMTYKTRWSASIVIQRIVRAGLARWMVARVVSRVWKKEYDPDSGYFAFTHIITGEFQHHKPWGMGTADLWSSFRDKINEHLLGLILGTDDSVEKEDDEDPRSWEESKKQRHRLYKMYRDGRFKEGPYCCVCGPGKARETRVTNVFIYPKIYHAIAPFRQPSDRQYASTRIGSYITCMDGLREKQARRIAVDPYFLVRNAKEQGTMAVISLMDKHSNNITMAGIGLQCMAGSLIEEDEAGALTKGQQKYISKSLELLRIHSNVEWIQAEACSALASMSSALSVRRELEKEHPDWLEDVTMTLMQIKTVTQVVKSIDSAGKETWHNSQVASPLSHQIALYGCRILANMACDGDTREKVACNSVTSVIHVTTLIPDDPDLAMTVATTLYNFVNRRGESVK